MDEVALAGVFRAAIARASGDPTTEPSRRALQNRARMLSRKLAAHFDEVGWPATTDEIEVYVREAVDRYC